MKDITIAYLMVVFATLCALVGVGILLYPMGEESIIEEDYMPEYSAPPDDVLITGEFKASDFAINQSWIDELSRNPTIQVSEDFGSDNLCIRLPVHPKGNITVYQGDKVVFQT